MKQYNERVAALNELNKVNIEFNVSRKVCAIYNEMYFQQACKAPCRDFIAYDNETLTNIINAYSHHLGLIGSFSPRVNLLNMIRQHAATF